MSLHVRASTMAQMAVAWTSAISSDLARGSRKMGFSIVPQRLPLLAHGGDDPFSGPPGGAFCPGRPAAVLTAPGGAASLADRGLGAVRAWHFEAATCNLF